MSLSPSALRQSIESALTANLTGWTKSNMVLDVFPGADTRDIEGLSFVVGLGESTMTPGRQRPGGSVTNTQVIVKLARRIRPAAAPEDYDDALDKEQDLLSVLSATSGTGHQRPTVETVEREVVNDGHLFVSTVTCYVLHAYPL